MTIACKESALLLHGRRELEGGKRPEAVGHPMSCKTLKVRPSMQCVPGISTAPTELDELQEIARVATRTALEGYEPMPEEWKRNLMLGTFFEGDERIFELYIAAEKPADAMVISTARVNRKSKEVVVTISNLKPR